MAAPGNSNSEQEQILIVEDSRTYSTTLGRKIRRRLGLPFLVATSMAEAAQMVEEYGNRIFLAILDLNLPDAPNGEVVELVTAKQISSLIVTATFSDAMRKKIVSRNVADYLVKESVRDIDYIIGFIERLQRNRHIKLLVADDSRSYRHMVGSVLRVHKFQVLEAADGVEACERLEEHPDIKLVVADYKMPRMDGFELIDYVRRRFAKDRIGFIGLSAHNQESLSAKFLKRGANDFLAKPFSKEEFSCRVRQNLEMIELTERVEQLEQQDTVTGLFNHRYLHQTGSKYIENAQRKNLSLSVALLAIDQLEEITEEFGGDAVKIVQRMVGEQISRNLRATDILATLPDGHFAVMSVNLNQDKCRIVFERIRLAVESQAVEYEQHELNLTVSIGVTHQSRSHIEDMLADAEAALDDSINAGGNNLCQANS